MMVKNSFVSVCLLFVGTLAIGQSSTQHLPDDLATMQNIIRQQPVEKVYLQYDRPCYAAGDTVYFKAYTVLGDRHYLSELSGVLYVDLLTSNDAIVRTTKLHLQNGMAAGNFILPLSAPENNYRIRSYTKWMLNDRQPILTDNIPVESRIKQVPVFTKSEISKTVSVTFFPEGGELVNGLRSKIAFKAIDTTGYGIALNGTITDNSNKVVTRIQTTHLGMGQFYLLPEDGKTYHASLIFENGTKSEVRLPVARSTGVVMAADLGTEGKIGIEVTSDQAFYKENRDKDITLVILSGGIVSTVAGKLSNQSIRFQLSKKGYPTGIMQITLLSPELQPLAERLVFIKNTDLLNLSLTANKPTFRKREAASIQFTAKEANQSPAPGYFSISVINESKCLIKEEEKNTILSTLLLSLDLHGYIEHSNYYFISNNKETNDNLDILLLTQGFRRFTWKKYANHEISKPLYAAEKFLTVSGELRSKSGKAVPDEPITLSDPNGKGTAMSQVTNAGGQFIFNNLVYSDSTNFNLKTEKKNTVIIPIDDTPRPIQDTITLVPHDRVSLKKMNPTINYETAVVDRIDLSKTRALKEVKIEAKPNKDVYRTQSLAGAGHADQVIKMKDIPGGGLPTDQLNGRLNGVVFNNGVPYLQTSMGESLPGYPPKPMLVIVDGAELSDPNGAGYNLNNLNLRDIETVEVLKSANASIYGMNAGGGVLVITTVSGEEHFVDDSDQGIFHLRKEGFATAKQFYQPKYEPDKAQAARPDLRTTVYWNPDLITDPDGKANVSYFNTDQSGTFLVTLEGIDSKGHLGRAIYRYKVIE